ncbi:MAG TPA: LacI family DNA-binding transcriptional regulator [Candidatus Limnocylindrales bacterium]
MVESTNIKEVARLAGVSAGTVSNVLNHPHRVRETTRTRVHQAITQLGYVRNDTARQLRTGSSRQIAVVVLNVTNPFFTDVVHGVEIAAEEHGVAVVVCNSGSDPDRERRHLSLLEEQRIRGVLITPVNDEHMTRLHQLAARGIPVVLVDQSAGWTNRCSVTVDDVQGGRLAAQHLLERGHRHLAFAGGPLGVPQVADRHRGFTDAACGARIAMAHTATLSIASGREAAAELAALPADERPTAVFCANDLLALGMLQGVMQRGLRVPQDVAIVGYDDIEFAAAATVPLSSVRQPREQLGRTAAELLLDEIVSGAAHKHRQVLFQPELIARASTDPGSGMVASGPR